MTAASGDQTEVNRETIRSAFEAWSNRTGSIVDVFAPEMVWRVEGHSAASRQYESKQRRAAVRTAWATSRSSRSA